MIRAFLIINSMAMTAVVCAMVALVPAGDGPAAIVITALLSGIFSAIFAIAEPEL